MHARQCGLFEAFTTSNDISMADVGVDLTPKIEQGYTVGEVKRAQSAWWHPLECVTSDSVKAMVYSAVESFSCFCFLTLLRRVVRCDTGAPQHI